MRAPSFVSCVTALLLASLVPGGGSRIADARRVAADPAPVHSAARWQPDPGFRQIAIWPGTPPDGTFRPQPPESVDAYREPASHGGRSDVVSDVAIPTMTVIPPRGRRTRTAVIVFPGGGFQKLFVTLEGVDICDWLTAQGITCIVSKYRVPGSNDFHDDRLNRQITPAIPRALQDAQRTVRLVRAQANALGIDPHRIGVMGFSAGGYLVAQVSTVFAPAYRAVDAIDRIGSRPDFAVALYPGHICRDRREVERGFHVTGATPPTFIAQAWDDETDPVCNSLIYADALDRAGVSTELHLFAHGGHAFALRKPNEPVGQWPMLVERWLKAIGML